jgi:hypothetical protein
MTETVRALERVQGEIFKIVARGGLPRQTKMDLLRMNGEIEAEKQKLLRQPWRKSRMFADLIFRIIKYLTGLNDGNSS